MTKSAEPEMDPMSKMSPFAYQNKQRARCDKTLNKPHLPNFFRKNLGVLIVTHLNHVIRIQRYNKEEIREYIKGYIRQTHLLYLF